MPKSKQRDPIRDVRLVLQILDADIRELQEVAEESCRDVPSEYKTHAAAAFAYEFARKRIARLDRMARKAGYGR